MDLLRNHKFRGGLLGITLIVTTANTKITTAEECTSSGNSLPLLVHIITTAVRITVRKLIQINIEQILCISYSIIIIRILQKRTPCAIKGGPRFRFKICFSQSFKVVTLVIQRSLVLLLLIILELFVCYIHCSYAYTNCFIHNQSSKYH